MTTRIYVPRDAAARSVGADATAQAIRASLLVSATIAMLWCVRAVSIVVRLG